MGLFCKCDVNDELKQQLRKVSIELSMREAQVKLAHTEIDKLNRVIDKMATNAIDGQDLRHKRDWMKTARDAMAKSNNDLVEENAVLKKEKEIWLDSNASLWARLQKAEAPGCTPFERRTLEEFSKVDKRLDALENSPWVKCWIKRAE